MTMKSRIARSFACGAAILALGSPAFAATPRVELINDFNAFMSDTLEYKSGPRTITSSCYLIRHGDQYLLWDTGFSEGGGVGFVDLS